VAAGVTGNGAQALALCNVAGIAGLKRLAARAAVRGDL